MLFFLSRFGIRVCGIISAQVFFSRAIYDCSMLLNHVSMSECLCVFFSRQVIGVMYASQFIVFYEHKFKLIMLVAPAISIDSANGPLRSTGFDDIWYTVHTVQCGLEVSQSLRK